MFVHNILLLKKLLYFYNIWTFSVTRGVKPRPKFGIVGLTILLQNQARCLIKPKPLSYRGPQECEKTLILEQDAIGAYLIFMLPNQEIHFYTVSQERFLF